MVKVCFLQQAMSVLNIAVCVVALSLSICNAEMLGKIVFHGETHDNGKSVLSILNKPESIRLAPSPGAIPSNEIASVLALSLGLSVPKDVSWAGLQVSNPFNLPRAVMMFSVDSLPKGHNLKLASSTSFPVNNVGGISSISDMYYITPKYSLSSHIGAIYEGQSKTVSISADEKIAASGHSNSNSAETSVWSDKTDTWKLVTGDGNVHDSLSRSQVIKRIADILISGFTLDKDHQTVTVNVKGIEVSFHLDDKTDFKLFSELVYIMWHYEEMALKRNLVRDAAPDVYMLSISALKDIEKKYGSDSKQVKAAVLLIEKFADKIVKKFTELYDGNIFIVGLTTNSEIGYFDQHKDEFEPMLKVLKENNLMLVNFDNSIPEIHVMDQLEADVRQKLCESMQASIAHSAKSMKIKCAKDIPYHRLSKRSILQAEADQGTSHLNLSSSYDDMFPVIFNIWFWLMVLLALTVYAVSVAMWNMDPGHDSIIYRLTQQKIKSE